MVMKESQWSWKEVDGDGKKLVMIEGRAVYAYAYAYAYALYALVSGKTLTRTPTRYYEIRKRLRGRIRGSMK